MKQGLRRRPLRGEGERESKGRDYNPAGDPTAKKDF